MGTPLVLAPASPSPSSSSASSERLRERATLLRSLARQLERSELVQLPSLTGSDTWLGARPFDCAADIRRLIGRFSIVAGDLRGSARLLELQADAMTPTTGPS